MAQSLRDRFIRLRAHYPDVVRFQDFDIAKFNKVYEQVKEVKDFAIVQYQEDLLNYVALAIILNNGKYESYVFMNAYELLDIYLGNKEELKCLSDIECQLAIIYFQGREFENKRQSDIVEQFMEMQRVEKKKCFVLYKGSGIESKYPALVGLFKDYKYPVITINGSGLANSHVDDEL